MQRDTRGEEERTSIHEEGSCFSWAEAGGFGNAGKGPERTRGLCRNRTSGVYPLRRGGKYAGDKRPQKQQPVFRPFQPRNRPCCWPHKLRGGHHMPCCGAHEACCWSHMPCCWSHKLRGGHHMSCCDAHMSCCWPHEPRGGHHEACCHAHIVEIPAQTIGQSPKLNRF